LDKLGPSLETVINAIVDPRGSDNDKVDAALRKQIGPEDTTESRGSINIKPNDIGVYGRF
jgi:hypothetical protein